MISSVPDLAELPLPPDTVGLLEGLRTTRTIRRYTDEPVPPEALRAMLFAATRAPSGSNRQAFRFLVLTDGPDRPRGEGADRRRRAPGVGLEARVRRLLDGLGRRRRLAEGPHGARRCRRYVDEFANVPVLVLPCLVRYREPESFEGASIYPAVQNLLLAARALGYGAALTGWHKIVEDELRPLLGIPDGVFIAATITIGRPEGSHGPVRRRPIGEVIFEDRWGETPAWAVDPPGTRFTAAGPPVAAEAVRRKAADMTWDFSTEPEFQEKLDWIDEFVRTEIEPIDLAFSSHTVYDQTHPVHREVIQPLQEQVKKQGLWACHLGPDLGGLGYGQVKLALMNEILGRSTWAPSVFGCQAPDSGNAEILAHYGTQEQKDKYLQPLLDGEIVSCFSMTEPQGGADPQRVHLPRRARRRRVGHQRREVVLVEPALRGVRDRDGRHRPGRADLPGRVDVPRARPTRPASTSSATPASRGEAFGEGSHAYVRYENVRVPKENVLGGAGQAFVIAQTRLGGGRIHHAMRTVGVCQKAIDMMCERALSAATRRARCSRRSRWCRSTSPTRGSTCTSSGSW